MRITQAGPKTLRVDLGTSLTLNQIMMVVVLAVTKVFPIGCAHNRRIEPQFVGRHFSSIPSTNGQRHLLVLYPFVSPYDRCGTDATATIFDGSTFELGLRGPVDDAGIAQLTAELESILTEEAYTRPTPWTPS